MRRKHQQKRGFKRTLVTLLTFVMLIGVCFPGVFARAEEVTDASTVGSEETTFNEETAAGKSAPETINENTSTEGNKGTNPGESTVTTETTTQPSDPSEPPVEGNAPTAPAETTEPTVGDDAHIVPPTHIETCVEGCTGENCECECHSFYARLMACKTIEEMYAILDTMTEEDNLAITEEQWMNINSHYLDIEPEPAPAVVTVLVSDPPVPSVYATEGDVIDPANANEPR